MLGGIPWEAKKWNLQLRWPKMQEALEASWGRLGRPKREPSWSKIAARMLFFKMKRHSYKKWSWNAFLPVLAAPGRSKNLHFAWERLQKTAFQDVVFQHRLETSLGEILEAKLGLSWSQVGLYKGSKWHVKVTSKSS